MKKSWLFLFAICSLWLLNGCGSSSSTPPPPVATHFSVTSANAMPAVGTAFNVTVTALDASGQTATGYSGTVHFTSTDGQAVLPANATLASGTGTFSVTLKTVGAQTITATDSSISGTSNSIMVSIATSHFSVTVPSKATTGIAFNITVTALDATNNAVTSYSGTVHFTSTDGQVTLPVDSMLANGAGTFSATLKTLGNQTITATDTASASVTGISSAISVGSAAATHFSLSGPLYGDASPGSLLSVGVVALDVANNTAPSYSGTVHFTSTDPRASLPANSPLTNGSGTFSATLNTVGTQITATDTVTPSITGTSHFNIAKLTITSGAPPNGTAGAAYGSTPNCYAGPGSVLGASGGNPGFHGDGYVWASTSLPPGLQIGRINYVSGSMCFPGGGLPIVAIIGAPTQAGTYKNVVITLHDNETPPATASATYTITIGAAAAANHAAEALSTLDSSTSHHHYKLVDLGTFGGPGVSFVTQGVGSQVLNDSGVMTGSADTSIPDPNAPNCLSSDCFISHAFKWQNGSLTDLGALPGVNSSFGSWISANGLIAGESGNGRTDPMTGGPEARGVFWSDDQIIDLGTFGGNESLANAVNTQGQVVGLATNSIPDPFNFYGFGTQMHAFLWQKGVMRDLGTLGGPDSIAFWVNEVGQVAGISYIDSTPNPLTGLPAMHPFLWENGKMRDLGTLGGTQVFQLNALNERGQVVGSMTLADEGPNHVHPFLWDGKALLNLGTLGGDFGEANWLNDSGEVVGHADTSVACPGGAGPIGHAFVWKDGVMEDLGIVPSADPLQEGSAATSINSKTQIVGESASCDFSVADAFLWEKGSMVDLNSLIPADSAMHLFLPLYITDGGEITGLGFLANGDLRSFLLIPCDESAGGSDCQGSNDVALTQGETNQRPNVVVPESIRKMLRQRFDPRYHIPGVQSPRK
jgi:probable HAF family extracellular repeat protein